MSSRFGRGLMMAVLLLTTPVGAQAEQASVNRISAVAEFVQLGAGAKAFADEVKNGPAAKFRVEQFPKRRTRRRGVEMIQAVQSGQVDVALITNAPFTNIIPEFGGISDVPVPIQERPSRARRSGWSDRQGVFGGSSSPRTVIALGLGRKRPAPPHQFQAADQADPQDLSGLKLQRSAVGHHGAGLPCARRLRGGAAGVSAAEHRARHRQVRRRGKSQRDARRGQARQGPHIPDTRRARYLFVGSFHWFPGSSTTTLFARAIARR